MPASGPATLAAPQSGATRCGATASAGRCPGCSAYAAHHGLVLVAEGRWEEAETEFHEAARLFAVGAPAVAYEAFQGLCDLRLRQGRLEEAEALAHEPRSIRSVASRCSPWRRWPARAASVLMLWRSWTAT